MQRQGFEVPLLIGGATTSRAHTAIKIAPTTTAGGLCARCLRAVGVVTSLLSEGQSASYAAEVAPTTTRCAPSTPTRRA
jgi:5-methyltetrahydrofolate--homocysteine methyltransferase